MTTKLSARTQKKPQAGMIRSTSHSRHCWSVAGTPEEAKAPAAEVRRSIHTAAPGTTYGHQHPQDLPGIWYGARQAGRRRIVLEVEVEAKQQDEDDGHINIRVLDAQNWPELKLERNPFLEDAVEQGALDLSTWTETSGTGRLTHQASLPALERQFNPELNNARQEQLARELGIPDSWQELVEELRLEGPRWPDEVQPTAGTQEKELN